MREFGSRHPELTVLSKPNGGQSSARNYGIRHSTSDLIALLDQDDVWYPGHLSELAKPFEQGTVRNLGLAYSNLDQIDVDGLIVNRAMLDLLQAPHPKKHLADCLGRDMFIDSSSRSHRMRKSRMLYFDKLKKLFPDDPKCWSFYTRDYLCPRFARTTMTDYAYVVVNRIPDVIPSLCADLYKVAGGLPLLQRAIYRLFSCAARI